MKKPLRDLITIGLIALAIVVGGILYAWLIVWIVIPYAPQ